MTEDTRSQRRTRTHSHTTTRSDRTTRDDAPVVSARQRAANTLRRLGQRLRTPAQRVRHALGTITTTGWCVIALTTAAAIAGTQLGWVESSAVAIAGAVTLAVAIPFLWGARAYRSELHVPVTHTVAGGTVQIELAVTNTAARPQLPSLAELPIGDALREIRVPLLGAHGSAHLPVTVATPHRGIVQLGPVTVSRADPLGILRRALTWRDTQQLFVHPRTVALPPSTEGQIRDLDGHASQKLTDADLSFHAVREYVAGDAMRHVHWKATAKRGTLMVRQYEETQSARVAVLFDANRDEYDSDEAFELGVSAAASLSVQAVRDGRERFVGSAWAPLGQRPTQTGLNELPARTPTELLNAWAGLQPVSGAAPLEALVSHLAHGDTDASAILLITGARPELARLRRATAGVPPTVSVLAVRAEPLADPTLHRFGPLTVATIGALHDLPRLVLRGAR